MKKTFTIITLFMTLLIFQLQAQIFVKHDATGANDGTSWGNAYTDLQAAITASSINDQIWVSAGTYKPGGDTPSETVFFSFPHDLELYGGFAGTETMLSERDWTTNETILSGDHDGDDIDNDFDNNKTDNSIHVMWLTEVITTATIIDGLSIKYGNTLPASGIDEERRGGGILSFGSPTVRNCLFEQNFGHFGAGFHAREEGAINFSLDNCTFRNNKGFNGGAMYNFSGAGTISNCTFEFNLATNRGACSFNASSAATYTNCNFNNNEANFDAAGIFIGNGGEVSDPINISNCNFINNSCTDWTGAMAIFGSFTTANITDCIFEGNSCDGNAGAILLAAQSTTNLTNCTFERNIAPTGRGGAIYIINQNTKLFSDKCTYLFNSAEVGGAISNSGTVESIDSIPLAQITLNDSYFQGNTSIAQGGAINTINTICNLTNTVIENNFVINTDGVGGGISFNTVDSIDGSYSLINCTISNNEAPIGAGIGHWKEGTESSSTLTLQNTILHNPTGFNYQIETGDPVIISNGGNLSSDVSIETILTNTNDLNNIDPLFINSVNSDFRLQNDSPCIDAGVVTGAPLMDIEGNERVDAIDMGAYENQKLVGTNSPVQIFGELNIFPNPVDKELNFSFKDKETTTLKIQFLDAKGKNISTQWLEKRSEIISRAFDVKSLSKGIYYLHISDGLRVNTKPFFKE